jgi:hypothetical protein
MQAAAVGVDASRFRAIWRASRARAPKYFFSR